jgi:hypothetical protein
MTMSRPRSTAPAGRSRWCRCPITPARTGRAPLLRRGLDGARARGAAAAGPGHARVRGRDDGTLGASVRSADARVAKTVWPIISQTARASGRTRRAGGRGRACRAAHRRAGAEHEPCGYPHASGPGRGAREDPGAPAAAARYARARHADILARVTGIDALNRASMVEAQGLRDMRMRALDAIYRVAPVRRVLMQTGSRRAGLSPSLRGCATAGRRRASRRPFRMCDVPSAMAKFIIRSTASGVTKAARSTDTAPAGHVPGKRRHSTRPGPGPRKAGRQLRVILCLLHQRGKAQPPQAKAAGSTSDRPASRIVQRTVEQERARNAAWSRPWLFRRRQAPGLELGKHLGGRGIRRQGAGAAFLRTKARWPPPPPHPGRVMIRRAAPVRNRACRARRRAGGSRKGPAHAPPSAPRGWRRPRARNPPG